MNMKNLSGIYVLIALMAVGAAFMLYASFPSSTASSNTVRGVYFVSHPAVHQALEGFDSYFDEHYAQTPTLRPEVTFSNGDGSPKIVANIVHTYVQNGPDAIIAMTTPAAQIANRIREDIPLLFIGVSDPISAGLVDSLSSPKVGITGTTSSAPTDEILSLYNRLFPNGRKVGILYSPNEANSQSIIARIEKLPIVTDGTLSLDLAKVESIKDIGPTAYTLSERVDAIFLIQDNTIASSVEVVIRAAEESRTPVFASDIASVERGALFTYGLNYADEGRAAARLLAQLLEKPNRSIPIHINTKAYLYLNRKIRAHVTDETLRVIEPYEWVSE